MLSAFTAQTIANLGYLREARRWWRTARRAADESEDRYTVIWIRGREIVRAGYEHRPLTSILQLIDEVEARIDCTPPVAAIPEFLSGKAQTLALMGEPASTEAENSLIRLRKAFDALPFPLKAHSDSLFTWGEERLRFTESLAIPISATTAGLTRRKIGHWRSIQQMTSAVRHRLSCNGQCVWWGLVTYSRAFATPKLL